MRLSCLLLSCVLPVGFFLSGISGAFAAEIKGSSQAEAAPSNTLISGSAGLRALVFEDDTDRSNSFGVTAELGIEHRLSDELKANIDVGARLETGSAFNYLSSEYRPSRSVQLYEATVLWAPLDELKLRAGAINQGFHNNLMLFSPSVSFPGVREFLYLGPVEFSAEQAIPSTESVTTNPAAGSVLPFYDTERARVTGQVAGAQIAAHVGHYSFINLPSSIAADSRLLGNDVAGIGPSATFASDFNGLEAGTNVSWETSGGLKPELGVAGLANLSAATGRGRAFMAFGALGIPASKQLLLTPHLDLYRAEGDAAVGSYSSAALGHGNRQGFSISVSAEWKKSGLALSGTYTRAAVIAAGPFQSDLTGFVFNLRKSYDLVR